MAKLFKQGAPLLENVDGMDIYMINYISAVKYPSGGR